MHIFIHYLSFKVAPGIYHQQQQQQRVTNSARRGKARRIQTSISIDSLVINNIGFTPTQFSVEVDKQQLWLNSAKAQIAGLPGIIKKLQVWDGKCAAKLEKTGKGDLVYNQRIAFMNSINELGMSKKLIFI
jgi:hypothetical protein